VSSFHQTRLLLGEAITCIHNGILEHDLVIFSSGCIVRKDPTAAKDLTNRGKLYRIANDVQQNLAYTEFIAP
jgi:hypothetical protein